MHYIFSNINRFEDDALFATRLAEVGFEKNDTFVFLNCAVPFRHARNFFHQFQIKIFHRQNTVSGREDWWGLENVSSLISSDASSSANVTQIKVDNDGLVIDISGNVIGNVAFRGYPHEKLPTTGYLVAKYLSECCGQDVTLVNFYGLEDNSTGKWNGHDWVYEEIVLRESYDILFIEPSGVHRIERPRGRCSDRISVSVIVPIYNVAQYLVECLDSLVMQTLRNYEVICVDDGSNDGSGDIAQTYAARDSRFKVVVQKNLGLSAARNRGITLAKGEYVYFLDGDDWLEPDALERLTRLSDVLRLDHLIFSSQVFSDQTYNVSDMDARCTALERYYRIPPHVANRPLSGVELFELLQINGAFSVSATLRLLRLSNLKRADVTFPNGLLHEDEYFTPLALLNADRAMALEDKFYHRRIRPNSITVDQNMTLNRILSCRDIATALASCAETLWEAETLQRRLLLERRDRVETAMLNISETLSLDMLPTDVMTTLLNVYRSRRNQKRESLCSKSDLMKESLSRVQLELAESKKRRGEIWADRERMKETMLKAYSERDLMREALSKVQLELAESKKQRGKVWADRERMKESMLKAYSERDLMRKALSKVRIELAESKKRRGEIWADRERMKESMLKAYSERDSMRETVSMARLELSESKKQRGKIWADRERMKELMLKAYSGRDSMRETVSKARFELAESKKRRGEIWADRERMKGLMLKAYSERDLMREAMSKARLELVESKKRRGEIWADRERMKELMLKAYSERNSMRETVSKVRFELAESKRQRSEIFADRERIKESLIKSYSELDELRVRAQRADTMLGQILNIIED